MKSQSHFWTECKSIVTLALPILVAQFAQTANGFVDTVMSGQVSPNDLAAVAVGSSVWVPVYLFLVGVMQGLTPFVSQLHGKNKTHQAGSMVQQGIWLAIPLGWLGFAIMRSMEPVLNLMEVDQDIKPLILGYLDGLSWGFPAITVFLAFRGLTEGLSNTKPVMVVSLIGLAVNVPVNYILIHGKLGLPALGGVGCGWATSIVMWLMLFCLFFYCWHKEKHLKSGLFQQFGLPKASQIYSIVRVGLPIGLSIFIEVSVFCIVALLIAGIGAQVVASHQIALNVASMLFMLPLSLSLALTIRVANSVGANNPTGLKNNVKSGLFIIVLIAVFNSTLMALFREYIAGIYTDDQQVIELASALLIFAAVFQISDCLQVGANGVLRGMKDTAIPMLITVVAYWVIGLPLGYSLGLTNLFVPAMHAEGFWYGLVAGLTAAAIMLCWRVGLRLPKALHPN